MLKVLNALGFLFLLTYLVTGKTIFGFGAILVSGLAYWRVLGTPKNE
jgi:hypothetical protein